MSTPSMLELAERCEKATGPDRELDFAIYAALNADKDTTGIKPKHRYLYGEPYTASLDAAMTLVPEGWNWGVWRRHEWPKQNAQVWHREIEASTKHGDAATPALALCAAALRANTKEQEQ